METERRDKRLWGIARKRAAFKKHLVVFVILHGFFWILWYLKSEPYDGKIPWPVWPMLGWGLGLAFNYYKAYHGDKNTLAEKEYEKLKKEKENTNNG